MPKTTENEKLVVCKLCGRKIPCTPGLAEMTVHWEIDHMEELAEMRREHGDPNEED